MKEILKRTMDETSDVSYDPLECWVSPSKRKHVDASENLLDPSFKNSHYACQQATPLICPNQKFVELLEVIERGRYAEGNERSALSYRQAIASIQAYPRKIQSEEEAAQIYHVGPKVAHLIQEYIETDTIKASNAIGNDSRIQTLLKFMTIYGVGFKTASTWYHQGFRSFQDLLVRAKLSFAQKQWLLHHEDLEKRFEFLVHPILYRA